MAERLCDAGTDEEDALVTVSLACLRLRRTWPQRLLIVFNVFSILAALATAAALTYVKHTVTEIPRIRLGRTLRPAAQVSGGRPRNYLIVGVDSRTGLALNDQANVGRQALGGTVRSDTIMVLRIDPRSTAASILSFPRDLWVPIAGTTRSSKINSAIETPNPNDGPDRLIRTLAEDFHVPIDHYLQIDLAQFQNIANIVGGVPVYFPTAARDLHSGLVVPSAGCITLDGTQALAYVRSRHYQYRQGNRWTSDRRDDFGRISRQQDFIRRLISRAITKGIRNPTELTSLLNTGLKSVTVDQTLTIGQIIDLGLRFRGFNPDSLKTYSLPVDGRNFGAASALVLRQTEAQPLLRTFQGQSPPGTAPPTPQQSTAPSTGLQPTTSQGSTTNPSTSPPPTAPPPVRCD